MSHWFFLHLRHCEYKDHVVALSRQIGELEAKVNMLAHLLGYRWFTTPPIQGKAGWQMILKEGQKPKSELAKPKDDDGE